MNIALDFDDTYTRDPILWDKFIDDALERGHDIRIVTFRRPEMTDPAINWIALKIPVIFTSFQQKRQYTTSIGWLPDIWIDDTPEYIVDWESVKDGLLR